MQSQVFRQQQRGKNGCETKASQPEYILTYCQAGAPIEREGENMAELTSMMNIGKEMAKKLLSVGCSVLILLGADTFLLQVSVVVVVFVFLDRVSLYSPG